MQLPCAKPALSALWFSRPFSSRNNPMTRTPQGFQGPEGMTVGMTVVTEVTIQLSVPVNNPSRRGLLFSSNLSQQYLLSRAISKRKTTALLPAESPGPQCQDLPGPCQQESMALLVQPGSPFPGLPHSLSEKLGFVWGPGNHVGKMEALRKLAIVLIL